MKAFEVTYKTVRYVLASYCPKCETWFRVEALSPGKDEHDHTNYEAVEQRSNYCYWCGEKLNEEEAKGM